MNRPAIRPFGIDVPDDALADLKSRLTNTRWPEQLPGQPWEHSSRSRGLRASTGENRSGC